MEMTSKWCFLPLHMDVISFVILCCVMIDLIKVKLIVILMLSSSTHLYFIFRAFSFSYVYLHPYKLLSLSTH